MLVMAFVPMVFAGTTGKIAGVVKDAQTGEPLPGVNVIIEGTTSGASTDIDGRYFIINVAVGSHDVTVSYIGFKTVKTQGVYVQPDRTSRVDFNLEETVLQVGEVILVEAQRDRIEKDLTMSSQYMSSDEMLMLPIESFEQAAQIQAGAVNSNFRGGRASETAPIVDGVNIKDPTGGYDAIQDMDEIQTSFIVPEGAIEEMEVITGGFNAEYGNIQSAVINVITKDGGSKHTGRISIKTALGTDPTTRYMFKDPAGNFVFERDEAIQTFLDAAQPVDSLLALSNGPKGPTINAFKNNETDGFDNKEFEFTLLGPVPFTGDKLRYSISGEYVDTKQQQMSYWGPMEQASVQTKITYKISPDYKLQFIGLGSFVDSRAVAYIDSKGPGGYMPGYGEIPAKFDTEEYDENRNFLGTLKWTHTLSNTTFYELQASYSYFSFERKTKDWNDRDGDGDTDEFMKWEEIAVPVNASDQSSEMTTDLRYTSDDTKYFWVDQQTLSDGTVKEGQWRFGVPGKSEWKQIWVLNKTDYTYTPTWRFVTGDVNEKELNAYPISEENEGVLYPTVTNAYFDYYGDGASYFDSKSSVINVKADIVSQVTPQHLVKGGVNFTLTDMDMTNIGYFSQSNLYVDDYEVTPYDFSAYVQDKMEFEGMIVNAGVRFDYYNPTDISYPGDFQDPVDFTLEPGDVGYITDPINAKSYNSISPRLGISHPISENTVLHFSYGHFYQRPEYRYWFENTGFDLRGAYSEVGNPDLKPEKTVAYEIGFQHNMGDYLLGVNAFYKDIFNLISQVQAGEAPFSDFWLYYNRDWADARGFELTLRKFFSNYFAGEINYTYMIARGKGSDVQSGGSELWRKLAGVQQSFYLDWDRRHSLNANVNISMPKDWGFEVGGYHPFGDWNFTVLYRYGSPLPYTPPTRDPQPEYNTKRLEATMTTDIKLEKRFAIGEDMRALIFFEGYNIFNRRNLMNFDGQLTNLDDVSWFEETGSYEGRNKRPTIWGNRRNFRVGLGFEF